MFRVGTYGPDLYKKNIYQIALYASIKFKNEFQEYVGPEVQEMPENSTTNDKRIWESDGGPSEDQASTQELSMEFVYFSYGSE